MILLVEDDAIQRQATAELLRRDGWKVREVGSAREALAQVRDRRPKIMVVDLVLPDGDLDGLELLRAVVREFPDTAGLRAIVTTATAGELTDLPCDCVVLRKPFELEELVGQIRKSAVALGVLPEVKAGA